MKAEIQINVEMEKKWQQRTYLVMKTFRNSSNELQWKIYIDSDN